MERRRAAWGWGGHWGPRGRAGLCSQPPVGEGRLVATDRDPFVLVCCVSWHMRGGQRGPTQGVGSQGAGAPPCCLTPGPGSRELKPLFEEKFDV